jgi:hypothetical protein
MLNMRRDWCLAMADMTRADKAKAVLDALTATFLAECLKCGKVCLGLGQADSQNITPMK